MGTTTSYQPITTCNEPDILTFGSYKFTNPDNTLRKLLTAPHTIELSDFDHCQSIYNVDIDGKIKQRTLIMIASRFGLIYPLKIMLENKGIKSLISFTNEDRITALMIASQYCNSSSSLECVNVLLQNGVDLNAQNKDGWTALMLAACYCNNTSSLDCVNVLLQNGADCDVQQKDGWTALKWARYSGTAECVNLLNAEIKKRAHAHND